MQAESLRYNDLVTIYNNNAGFQPAISYMNLPGALPQAFIFQGFAQIK
jgi:hypothetical protein